MMSRAAITSSLAAVLCAAVVAGGHFWARPVLWAAPRAAEGGWVPLDISAAMNHDIVQTPNEWLRCLDLYRQDVLRGDEDDDLQGSALEGQYTANLVFGQHSMTSWGSTSYHVAGMYPRFVPGDVTHLEWFDVGPDGGLPAGGRVGSYRLHMDELESPDWAMSRAEDKRAGRNAVRLRRRRADDKVAIALPQAQQRRYRALNLLFAAEINYTANCVRITARYADDTTAQLFQGALNDFHGEGTFLGDRRQPVDLSRRQREVVRCTPYAAGWRNPAFRSKAYGYAVMSEFAQPLRLDGRKVLAAIEAETVHDGPGDMPLSGDYWNVDILAAIALPAEAK